jgi:hypothetical protein
MVDALSLFSINLLTTSLFTKSIISYKNNDRFSEFSVLFRAEVNEKEKYHENHEMLYLSS